VVDEDITKGKKRRGTRTTVHHRTRHERIVITEDLNAPVHPSQALADLAHQGQMCEEPDMGKATGNPVAPVGGQSYSEARVSAPLTAGRAAPSTGDHGVGAGRRAEIAVGHDTMRQHQAPTGFDQVLSRLRTVAGDNAYGDKDITYMPGEVALRMFDAAGQAGNYHGMQQVNPSPQRPDWHQSRGSATMPNGSHGLSNPGSHAAPAAVKASDAREILRRHMFPGSGAR
jgi:hypothetical protein